MQVAMCTNHDDKTMMIENIAVRLLFFQANIKKIGSLLVDQANLEYSQMKLPLVNLLLHHYPGVTVCIMYVIKKIHYVQMPGA